MVSRSMKHCVGIAASLMMAATVATAQDTWSYSGSNGPDAWHTLSNANALCAAGRFQSPINIEGTEPVVMNRLRPDYRVSAINLAHRRTMIAMDYENGSYLRVGRKVMALNGFLFRTPGEHTINGESFPMSIQFMHRASNGDRAIVVAPVKEGRENRALSELMPHLPIEPDQRNRREDMLVNARDLMPDNKDYFRYEGSLTMPPCAEGISWYIFKEPIEASAEQINLIKGVVGGDNARPLQRRGNRLILDARGQ